MGLFHFFRPLLRMPLIAFRVAGLLRITNRAKKGFKRTLLEANLPEEIVEELANDFDPSAPLRETLFRFLRG